ncbi:hypothetical protein [Natroniella sp. ANB-PHB2]|uniref:hypothetical protein n=1 Tax=Natroniella sp. ANB-PHB2 TaxID=3384444 RepID=UPI0038D4AB09
MSFSFKGLEGIDGIINDLNRAIGSVKDVDGWVVGTGSSYAVYVEYGAENMEAQSYMRRAAKEVLKELPRLEREADGINDLIKKVALRIERLAKKYCPVDTGNLKASIEAERIRR